MSLDSEFDINPVSNEADFSLTSSNLEVDFDVNSSNEFEAIFEMTIPSLSATFDTSSASLEATFSLGGTSSVPYATDTEPGVIRIATSSEATSGTSTSTAITPKQLQDHIVLTDSTPTEGSIKPVSSSGLFNTFATKQDILTSGTNIKTINNISVLGSGNIDLSAGATSWGAIQGNLSNQTDLQEALDNKQGTLSAGSNIVISGGVISATDTKYLSGNNISIDPNNIVSAVDTKYYAGDNITIDSDNKIHASTGSSYSAGENISIIGKVISAVDTTYTAGEGISISDNNVISNTQTSAEWGNIIGDIEDQEDLQEALEAKQDTVEDLSTIRSNATAGKSASDTIINYGNIVTHNTSEFASSEQGSLANSALQPNDDITELINNAGYVTKGVNNLDNYMLSSSINEALSLKQHILSAGENISINNNIISATDTTYTAGNGLTLTGTTFSANVINNVTSTSTTNSLSANMGKELQDQINNLSSIGHFLSNWDCSTGLAQSNPTVNPRVYNAGDYFVVGVVSTGTNYRPDGTQYVIGQASTTVETEDVQVNDVYHYDGSNWILQNNHGGLSTVSFSNITGQPTDNTNLSNALDAKQNTLTEGSNISIVNDVISFSGTIPTKVSDLTDDTATNPVNKADTLTDLTATVEELNILDGATVSTQELNFINGITSSVQAQLNNKQSTLKQGDNISIVDNTISATDTKYTAGTGISISDNNVISNTQTSAEWGNIIGDIEDQEDLQEALEAKQDLLSSGTNIKTINNNSLLGSGNILIQEGVTDVKVNGTSVVSSGVAELQVASTSALGLVRIDGTTITINENGVLTAHGGGGSSGFTLTTNLPSSITYSLGDTASISYTYTSVEGSPAVAQFILDNNVVATQTLTASGNYSLDIKDYLTAGEHNLRLKVTDEEEVTHSLYFTITVISISITSVFDSSAVYSSDVQFRYTPVGNVAKTVHFSLDNIETTETVTTSGRQLTKTFTGLTHGSHPLRVWMTAIVNSTTITSNELYFEIMYSSSYTGVIIASDFNQTSFKQGEVIELPFSVYDPESATSNVSIYVDNVLKSELTVDRTRQTWSTSITTTGSHTIKLQVGSVYKEFALTITAIQIDVQPVTQNLDLYLSAFGRSNQEATRSQWVYNSISCTLSNFNWVTNGWLNGALVISNSATVSIPYQPFSKDIRTNGKTIEIEFSTSNIRDINSEIITCYSGNRGFKIKAQQALLKSEQTEVSTKFKEDEKLRIAFVIENRNSNRLIYTYINGIISGLKLYPSDDDFQQVSPVNISIGSNTCDINIYTIRVYDTDLGYHDVLNNFIADTTDLTEKLERYNRNNIYDAFDVIQYNSILAQVPIMTITGELPPAKGTKKLVSVKYENQQEPARSFEMTNVTLDIQGTSSQYYPKKNYKISKMPTEYSLRAGSKTEKVFTLKADYMESSHAHNTGLTRFANDTYFSTVPPQASDSAIRTAIDGFPIAIYYKEAVSSTPVYFGVYNFNNDKESNNVWGFVAGDESWGVENNTSDRCLFKSDDFTDVESALTDFEARYPADYTDLTKLHQLVAWVVSCDSTKATGSTLTEPVTYEGVTYTTDSASYRIAKFRDECEDHFNMDYILSYYVISEFFGMVDSRAKNLFLNYYASTQRWYPVFYDADTMIGLNNEGVNDFSYNIEYHDTIGAQYVFNGESSALWNMLERSFPDEIKSKYNSYRGSSTKLTYNNVMNYLNTNQIAKICEAQYNEDAQYKYISPLVDEGISTYLYVAQGSRIDHIKYWLTNRFKYLDSKYYGPDYLGDYITLRLYTPQTWEEVEPNADITLTSYIDQYCNIKYGSYTVGEKVTSGTPVTIEAPAITFNDTETIIYGAGSITSIGDMSPLYAGTIDISSAVKLTTLTIGHGGEYSNTNLRSLTLGNNTLLQSIDVRNCPNLSNSLDLSNCIGLKTVKATGTSLTAVNLPTAGAITTLELPTTITNLTIKNQNNITTFSCGYSNVTTLVLENVNLNYKSVFESCTNVTKVRLVGIDWSLDDLTILDTIYALQGQDDQGVTTDHGILKGIVRLTGVRRSVADEYEAKFVGLTVVVTSPIEEDNIYTDDGDIIITNSERVLVYTESE